MTHTLSGVKGLQQLDCMNIKSGVYFLRKGETVYYIGQSCNLLSRISNHMIHREGQFDSVAYISWPRDDLDRIEGALIRFFKPPGNASIRGVMVAPFETYPDDMVLHELGIAPQTFLPPATFTA